MKLLKNKTGAMDMDDREKRGSHRREGEERESHRREGEDKGSYRREGEDLLEERGSHRREGNERGSHRRAGEERGSVLERLDMGRSWNRAEDRMERQRSGRHKTESPIKKRGSYGDRDLRAKLKKSLKSHNLEEPSENVTFTKLTPNKPDEWETDEIVLGRRDKQIEYGKNTIDYDTYCRIIPKEDRKDTMPRTPVKHKKYSRRQWDGMIKNWKQMIHTLVGRYNENEEMDEESEEGTSVSNWADEVEEEEMKDRRRRRVDDDEDEDEDGGRKRAGSTSTDQGLGSSVISASTSVSSLDMLDQDD